MRASSQIVSNRMPSSLAKPIAGRSSIHVFASSPIIPYRAAQRTAREGLVRHQLFFDDALLPSGWARDVRVGVVDGIISSVEIGAERNGAERIAGIAVPGMPNVHCHAFQRGLAGLSERRGP